MTLANLLGPPYAPEGQLTYIDLQPKANRGLGGARADSPGTNNTLKELPRGEQTFGGVRFRIADEYMQLAGQKLPQAPKSLENVSVDRHFARLYLLHATEWGEVPWAVVADGTVIGQYKVCYEDESVETVPIVYGEDVRDWWDLDGRPVGRATVVWVGSNRSVAQRRGKLRLYLSVWKNPHPEKKVVSIDFVSANTDAAPSCVAMTVEEAVDTTTDY